MEEPMVASHDTPVHRFCHLEQKQHYVLYIYNGYMQPTDSALDLSMSWQCASIRVSIYLCLEEPMLPWHDTPVHRFCHLEQKQHHSVYGYMKSIHSACDLIMSWQCVSIWVSIYLFGRAHSTTTWHPRPQILPSGTKAAPFPWHL